MNFSKFVKKALAEKKLGVREVSRQIGVDASFFSKVLAGKRSPPSEERIIKKLAKVIGVNHVYLFFIAGRIPSELREMFLNDEFIEAVRAGARKNNAEQKEIKKTDIARRQVENQEVGAVIVTREKKQPDSAPSEQTDMTSSADLTEELL